MSIDSASPLRPSWRNSPVAPPSHRSHRADPLWTRLALRGLLLVTAVAYLWNLSASGYANSFYAAAVEAGTKSWQALLFGSLDSANLITVDKPPAALWVMALSGRIFGFSSWSMLVPQALLGVSSVALLYAAVRRWSGAPVGLAAAAALAVTPVAALMFRFNNPDALLVLLEVAAGYTTVRAVDAAATRAGTRWLVATGVLLGFGFLTKMLQVMLVVPALAGVYLLVAEVRVGRRVAQLAWAGVALVVSAGWYVALVQLWPASSRPYIGGSNHNSLLELVLGYNGLSRLTGGSGSGGPGGAGPSRSGGGGGLDGFGGTSGLGRLFNSELGGQISWLLPAALVALLAGLWLTRRAPRGDRSRAGLVLWGGWLVVTALVLSLMGGIMHAYYSVALAPGLAATLAIGTALVWARREHWAARVTFAAGVTGSAAWSAVLLTRTPEFLPWLPWTVLGAGAVAGLAVLLPPARWAKVVTPVVVVAGLVAAGAGTTAYTAVTVASSHHGSIVTAGPVTGIEPDRGPGTGMGGTEPSTELVVLLRTAGTTWSAATVGAQDAATLELASGSAVMALGGFIGSDPAPTLGQFTAWVAEGKVRYFISSAAGSEPGRETHPAGPGEAGPGGFGPGGTDSQSAKIRAWVERHYSATTVGGYTVYDLATTAR